MPKKLDELMEKIAEEQRMKRKVRAVKERKAYESVDMDVVDEIVNKMKKKYVEEGREIDEMVKGELSELRSIIAEGGRSAIKIQKVEELTEFRSPLVKTLGSFYLSAKTLLMPLTKIVSVLPPVRRLGHYLYSANMRYSVRQYIALTVSIVFFVFIISLAASFSILSFLGIMEIEKVAIVSVAVSIAVSFFAAMIALYLPKSRARARANALSAELPFALRHMATELRSGMGLYKTLQTIAVADYGVLSEEFARTINEVEEGVATKDALRNFAMRVESPSLKSTLLHIIRALRTGGNLSEIMTNIAEDVSFEMRMRIRDFSEKMNFFGVVFTTAAIVFPVMVAIFGAVTNAPTSISISISPILLLFFFIIMMPSLLALLIFYIKIIQPQV